MSPGFRWGNWLPALRIGLIEGALMIGTAIVFSTVLFSSALMMCVATIKYQRNVNNAPITLFLVGLFFFCAVIFGGGVASVSDAEKAALKAPGFSN